ncbi:MAG: GyrI-like domain-containing protein [Oscillospiraceae bacterium]|nr:GyrI-like domain-containing protein [Oscillospiraceae bacterium]MCR5306964.1 GyrI-like domain-containing protein [Oscillospiraceae bacterium]
MKVERTKKASFTVIGREGSTAEGAGFVQRLWQEANAHFEEIAGLVRRDAAGNPAGFWGAMSDLTRSFLPWENFETGLYLAGAECRDDAEPPEGWVKWVIPAYEYLYTEQESDRTFPEMLQYLKAHQLSLAGAVHDFTDPCTGKNYLYFPIRKL